MHQVLDGTSFLKPGRTTRVQRLFLLDEHHGASCADGFAVNSTIDLLPDLLDLAKHAEAVAPNRDFASRIMVPPHGYFPQSQSGQLRNIEQFDVETESIDGGGLDYGTARAQAKRLEAALRIPEGQSRHQSHGQIKDPPTLFAPPRLMHPDQAAVQRA